MKHSSLPFEMDIRTLAGLIERLPAFPVLTADLEHELQIGVGYGNAVYASQKEHWLTWLAAYETPGAYNRKGVVTRDARSVYQRLNCAPMLFWLSDAAGLDDEVLKLAFKNVVAAGRRSATQGAALRQVIPWEAIKLHLLSATLPPVTTLEVARRPTPRPKKVSAPRNKPIPRKQAKAPPVPSLPPIPDGNWRMEFCKLEGAYAPSTMRSYFSDLEVCGYKTRYRSEMRAAKIKIEV